MIDYFPAGLDIVGGLEFKVIHSPFHIGEGDFEFEPFEHGALHPFAFHFLLCFQNESIFEQLAEHTIQLLAVVGDHLYVVAEIFLPLRAHLKWGSEPCRTDLELIILIISGEFLLDAAGKGGAEIDVNGSPGVNFHHDIIVRAYREVRKKAISVAQQAFHIFFKFNFVNHFIEDWGIERVIYNKFGEDLRPLRNSVAKLTKNQRLMK